MNPNEKAQADELIRRQSLFYLYRVFNGALNKVHLKALQDPLILSRQHLVDFAGQQEIQAQTENESMWYNLNMLVGHWREELGLSEEGRVQTEQYNHAVKRNESLRAEFAEGGSADKLEKIKRGWPFQDREEFF
ncbi:serine/threonine protein kinase [Penicillium capsulatum]|uniref:Serine/threonine protein kinase n=1 Tax=Penicillium capsulatum TaxID=69766 RepID=A0A9W9LQE9_9EURO|nr:serine/threonine protein kinase [Penicillium capsulatum]